MEQRLTSNEVAALTGISLRQLQWWDERGLVVPAREGHRRLYSLDDLAEVAVISELRKKGFSLQRMRKVVRGWCIPRQTPAPLAELAEQYNSVIRGWWEYYGSFYQTAMRELFRYIDRKLEQWARRKYKTLSRHKRRSVEWLARVKEDCPRIFAHWSVLETRVG